MLNLFQHPLIRESAERVEKWTLKQVQGDGSGVLSARERESDLKASAAFDLCTV
jgi:hypothetical protein